MVHARRIGPGVPPCRLFRAPRISVYDYWFIAAIATPRAHCGLARSPGSPTERAGPARCKLPVSRNVWLYPLAEVACTYAARFTAGRCSRPSWLSPRRSAVPEETGAGLALRPEAAGAVSAVAAAEARGRAAEAAVNLPAAEESEAAVPVWQPVAQVEAAVAAPAEQQATTQAVSIKPSIKRQPRHRSPARTTRPRPPPDSGSRCTCATRTGS